MAALAVLVSSSMVFQASAFTAYDTSTNTLGNQGPGYLYSSGPYNLGEQFTVNQDVTVTALGAFNSGALGWGGETITVAIYDPSQAIVGTAMQFFGSGANEGVLGDGGSAYRFLPVTPFTLNAGLTYTLVASGLGSAANPDYNSAGFPTLINLDTGGGALSFGDNYYDLFTGTPAYPTSLDGGPPGRYGAGSFEFTVVPEPGSFAILGAGLLGLICLRCRPVLRRWFA